jgi:hypothetical protein
VTAQDSSLLIQRCSDVYWFPDSRYTIDHIHRMAQVFTELANEIETWAPDKTMAPLCYRTVMDVADRLRRHSIERKPLDL